MHNVEAPWAQHAEATAMSPTLEFMSVYRLRGLPSPPAPIQAHGIEPEDKRYTAWLDFDAPRFELQRYSPAGVHGDAYGQVGEEMVPVTERVELPLDWYLILVRRYFSTDALGARVEELVGAHDELATLFESIGSASVDRKVAQGFLPSNSVMITNPSDFPHRFVCRNPVDSGVAFSAFLDGWSRLSSLDDVTRGRFLLASRWYSRGRDTSDGVDRFLSWYIALEAIAWNFVQLKTKNHINIPDRIPNVIVARMRPDVEYHAARRCLHLGNMEGLRGEIVHHGVARCRSREELDKFLLYHRILESLLVELLRATVGLPYAGFLDEWLTLSRDNESH